MIQHWPGEWDPKPVTPQLLKELMEPFIFVNHKLKDHIGIKMEYNVPFLLIGSNLPEQLVLMLFGFPLEKNSVTNMMKTKPMLSLNLLKELTMAMKLC